MANKIGPCSVGECDNIKQLTKGMCSTHYMRLWRYGSPHIFRGPVQGKAWGIGTHGYIRISGQKLEHIAIAEKALGKPLPKAARIHHWNEIKTDNRPENLLICPNDAYHMLIHMRMRALDACGNADWRKCQICKQYDDPANLVFYKNWDRPQSTATHRVCTNERARRYIRSRKELQS